ncbi:MAG: DNA mismatch repair protein MutS [Phycisphaerales bacterium]
MTPPNDAKLTPAMRQYAAFKKKHPDCVLFFRMGDFYEMFYDDAELCHRVLGITLTERSAGVPMAGVPYHSVESYLRKLIEQGYRVAVADQVQDPREAKGIVDRAVTRVVTPGTLVDASLLDDARANCVGAVLFTEAGDDSPACVAVAELSTGSFQLVDVGGETLGDELARLGVAELLYADTATGEAPARVTRHCDGVPLALTGRPGWHFRHVEAHEALTRQFGVSTLAGFGLDDSDPAVGAAGALVRFLLETQTADDDTSRLRHLRPPHRRTADAFVAVDQVSLRSLEIERTMRTGEVAGTLLGVLQCAITPMGKRLLRDWLCFPLRDADRIRARQRAVSAFVEDREFLHRFETILREIQDVSRIAGRVVLRRATPRDLVALGRSVAPISRLRDLLEARPAFDAAYRTLSELIEVLIPIAEEISAACVDAPPAHLREGGLFRDGFDASLDECRGLQRDANEWLARYQRTLVEETGIPSLKVGYNKVFGYYIEVTSAHRGKTPDEWTRKQTLKNAERYITPPLKEFESKVLSAEQRAIDREQTLFAALVDRLDAVSRELAQYAETVAALDVPAAFARRAIQRSYVRPEIVDEPMLEIRAGRHPVLDELLGERFVPNDTSLGRHTHGDTDPNNEAGGADSFSLALITGPNMAGKSTYIRQVALVTLLAHTGSFVPAERAVVGLVDRIFTRIGASDELHAGRSTFMVEMTETANILHHATDRSLVVLDEIGRGTSTLDGLSLAWAIAEQLAEIGARTLFATHYHELTTIADQDERVGNLHVAVREWADEIVFLYRILPGRTGRSYGIHVAKIAGLPTAAIERARSLLESLEVQSASATGVAERVTTAPPSGTQMSLFTEYLPHPVVQDLRTLDLDQLTPLQAFDLLRRLREQAADEDKD